MTFRTAILGALILSQTVSSASADDNSHGRLRGDVVLEGSIGGGVTFEGPLTSGAATLELRARYLDSAGIVLGGEARPEGASRLLLMIDFRPLFLIRFFLGAGFGDRYWDLFLDSIGLDLGVALGPLDDRFGAALAVGFGVEIPLVFFGDSAEGMGLRLYGRHVASQANDRLGPGGGGLNDWIVGAALVFRTQLSTGLPAWEPRRYEVRE